MSLTGRPQTERDKEMPLVSVIVVNYNGRHYLKDCFDTLRAGAFSDFEIVFVDNGSRDRSVEFVRENYPEVKAVDNGENLGLAIASNRGAEYAKGKYLFFYNNDTRAGRQMLKRLVEEMEKDPRLGICGCTTMTYDGREVINSGVACDIYGYPFGDGEPLYVDAAIFIRREVFDEIGGFDPEMFLYGEDRDICWRTLLYGYDVRVVPEAVFFHDSFCALKEGKYTTNVWKRHVGERNLIRSLLKNYQSRTLLKVFPKFLALSLAEIMLFTLMGRFKVVWGAYIKAWWWNIERLWDTLKLRKKVQKERRRDDSVVLERMGKRSGKLELFKKIGVPKFASD